MIKHKLHKYQENLFNIVIFLSYALIILSSLGLSKLAPKYLEILDYYVRIYICLFLIWRFNPFRNVKFTSLDKKIAFNAGIFVLFATTSINQILITYLKNKFNF